MLDRHLPVLYNVISPTERNVMSTVFKVTSYGPNGHFRSYIQYATPALDYIIGRVTTPKIKNSLIFVFRTLSEAKDFITSEGSGGDTTILECETEHELIPIAVRAQFISMDECEAFWSGKGDVITLEAPPASYGVKSLKPLRVVA